MSTSLSKKLVAYHIARLKDKSKDVRLKSIQELVELADREALSALETLYKSEPDAEVRKAAQEAGLAIFNATRDT
jgi:HEAT repeat protein